MKIWQNCKVMLNKKKRKKKSGKGIKVEMPKIEE